MAKFKPLRLLLLTSICVALCAAAAVAQTPPGIDEVYLAKDDGTGHADTAATTIFLPTDIPIYCVVQLDAPTPATVKMDLVAASVPGVKAETKVVSASYTTKNGQNRVNFYGKPDGTWAPGKYRADIFVDGKLATNVAFEIKAPAKAVTASRAFQPGKTVKPKTAAKKKPQIPFTTAQNFHR
jgi:hypothetical protein